MARVAFYQDVRFELHGVMSLAAVLEANGHATRAFIGKRELERSLVEFGPDLAAFTCASAHAAWTRDAASWIRRRRPDLPVIVGGVHSTVAPESMLGDAIEGACVGEGEAAILEAARRTDRHEALGEVQNLVHRRNGALARNALAPMVEDLDTIPDPCRDVYYAGHPDLARSSTKPFFAGRGCPFACSFCFHGELRRLYRAGSGYVRLRSVERVLAEVERVRSRWGLRRIFFFDDIFTVNREYALAFLARYRVETRLPFRCYISVRHQDPELLAALKGAGCDHVEFGVESGNEAYRTGILNKPFKDGEIREAALNIRDAGLRFSTGNVFRMPGETFPMAMDTVTLNAAIRPDSVLGNLFQPYRGLSLTEHGVRIGAVDPDRLDEMRFSSFRGSEVRGPDSARIARLHLLFGLAVRFPALIGLVRRATLLPLDPLYRLVFWTVYAVSYRKRSPMGAREILTQGWNLLRQFRSIFQE